MILVYNLCLKFQIKFCSKEVAKFVAKDWKYLNVEKWVKQFLRQIVYVEKIKHLSIDHETADFNLHPWMNNNLPKNQEFKVSQMTKTPKRGCEY